MNHVRAFVLYCLVPREPDVVEMCEVVKAYEQFLRRRKGPPSTTAVVDPMGRLLKQALVDVDGAHPYNN